MRGFSSHGSCIYCGSTELPLGREHIIPYGLCSGDQFVLPKASCERHAEITSKFELAVLRGPMWPIRAHLRLKSRHAKVVAPKTAPVTFTKVEGSTVEENVALTDHPLLLFFPLLKPPSELSGDHRRGVDICGELTFRFGVLPDATWLQRRQAIGFSIQQSYRPVQFAQLMGKIAWGFAAAEGMLKFLEPSQSVLCGLVADPDSIGRWVGSADAVPTMGGRPAENALHEVLAFEQDGYLLYRIQLFTSYQTPYYWVVVGRLCPGHPKIQDPISVPEIAAGLPVIEILRSLQPGSVPASTLAPRRMTGLQVRRNDGSVERFRT